MLEEDRKRRQFEEQKQKLRLLSSVKPKVIPSQCHLLVLYSFQASDFLCVTLCLVCAQTGEKSRDDALEAIKGNLDGFSRDAKMHPTPSSQTKKPGRFSLFMEFLTLYSHFTSELKETVVCWSQGCGFQSEN